MQSQRWDAQRAFGVWFATLLVGLLPAISRSDDLPIRVDFARDVRPILVEKCLGCHAGAAPEGGLRLGERRGVLGAGDSGRIAVVPGQPEASELIRRIKAADESERMPPPEEKPLTPAEVEVITMWVAEGGQWSDHWAFEVPVAVRIPALRQDEWMQNSIDVFVLREHQRLGVSPSLEADPYTLIKRLHYDLVGLPPTVEEVDAFVADHSPSAYSRLVDRLLQSPRFGERWARHWLDLAHFADTDGYEKDRARPDAHYWRDWVIDAINSDVPFDQFTLEQLAGDLLPGATARQRMATGFLRQTLTNEEGGVDQEEFRIAACFDRTETVGTVWLGLTVGCARCHDHKYDPLSQKDYYRFFAFFNGAEEVTAKLPVAADNLDELERQLQPLEAALQARLEELAPAALDWETHEHQHILAQREGTVVEHPAEIVSITSSARPDTRFQFEGDTAWVDRSRDDSNPGAESGPDIAVDAKSNHGESKAAAGPGASDATELDALLPDKDTYLVTLRIPPRVTGFKLYALPDATLPAKGPGLAADGNFVLTAFQASIVAPDGEGRSIELHRARAEYAARGFSPDQVLADRGVKQGWSISGRTSRANWIQLRTREPLQQTDGALVRIALVQQYGGRHLLGRFRLAVLTGGERGLHLSNETIAGALEMYPEKRVASSREQLFAHFVTEVARDEQALEFQRRINQLYQQHRTKLVELRTMGMPRMARTTRLFDRGDFLSPAHPVDPGVPEVLATFQSRAEHGDRLDLARWLVGGGNSLTSRVVVNRVWQHLFGAGLVRTPEDLGSRGEAPTHPELLDWLAVQFREDLHWSRKALIRLIVNSATYRQASHHRPELETRDPGNRWLYRQNRFRVESEVVRDLNLSIAGLLSSRIGGPSVFPPMPADLAKLSYANNFTWQNSVGEDRYRRGMYTFFKRTIPHPNLMTFDSPDANVACVRRTTSNTPLQALTLLNGEAHVEAAQSLAVQLLSAAEPEASPPSRADSAASSERGSGSSRDAARLIRAFRLCVARPPAEHELQSLSRVLAAARDYYISRDDEANSMIGRTQGLDVEATETAAWVATVRVVLNLDEFMTRE